MHSVAPETLATLAVVAQRVFVASQMIIAAMDARAIAMQQQSAASTPLRVKKIAH